MRSYSLREFNRKASKIGREAAVEDVVITRRGEPWLVLGKVRTKIRQCGNVCTEEEIVRTEEKRVIWREGEEVEISLEEWKRGGRSEEGFRRLPLA